MLKPFTWFKTLTLLFILGALVIGLTACRVEDDSLEKTAIETVLETVASGTEVRVGGTIYYADANGVYLSDSALGKIYVRTDVLPAAAFTLVIGQEIELIGTFNLTNHKPEIRNVSTLTLVSQTGTVPEAQVTAVASLLALDRTVKTGSWYPYVELKGKITIDPITLQTVFEDDAGDSIAFSNLSNDTALAAKEDMRVTLKAVLGEYSTFANEWRLVFTGAVVDIVESPFTRAEVIDRIDTWLSGLIPADWIGKIELPATYDRIDDVVITWATNINQVEILALEPDATAYQTAIDLPLEDVIGHVTATVTYADEDPFDLVFDITVKALVMTDLKTALESEATLVMFEAVVIGFAETQTLSQRSLIVQDLAHPNVIITVDYNQIIGDDYGLLTEVNPQIGDILIVAGTYRTEGRPSIVEPFVTDNTGLTQDPVYPFEDAVTFTDSTSWRDFPGHNVFVKLVNPYMRYSTSAMPGITNWIRMGYDESSVGTNFGPNNNKSFAFLIRPVDAMLGSSWRNNIGVPLLGDTPVQYDGVIYAFIIYESATYLQMFIVNPDHVMPNPPLAVQEFLLDSIAYMHEEGDLALPDDHPLVDAGITWTSSHPDIVSNIGLVTFPETDTVVTLTASYEIDSVPYVLEIDVLIVGQIKIVLQVDDVRDLEDGAIFNVEGLVLNAGYNTAANLSDIFLQDKISGNIMLVKGLTGYGDDFNIGDLIEFNATLEISTTENEAGKRTIIYVANFVVLETDQMLLDYRQHAIVIDSHEAAIDLLSVENRVVGGVYLFYGNYFINGTTSAYSPGSLNARFHLNPHASGIGDIRYGTKTMVMNDNGNRPTLGENWVPDILGITEVNYPGVGYPGLSYTGGFYAILKNITNSYYYWSVISPDDFIDLLPVDQIHQDLSNMIPETLASGDLELPISHPLADDAIVWSSSHPDVIDIMGNVTYGSEEVEVTLTATFDIEGVEHVLTFVVNVLVLPSMTVTEVIEDAVEGDTVKVTGIIVGFHWNGSGSVSAMTNGIIIKEATGNDVLYVVGLYGTYGSTRHVYDVDGHILALGDEVEFVAEYTVQDATGFAGRRLLTIVDALSANLQVLNTDVPYSFDLASAILLDSDVDLNDLAENLTYGQLYKLQGAFSLRSSATGYGTAINMVPSFANSAISDFNRAVTWADRDQRFSFKFDGNSPHLGDAWWETYLNITSENFNGTASDGHVYDADSYIYFYVGNALPTAVSTFGYIQLVILDASFINTTRVLGD